jgi:hypothetical protein
VNMIINTYFCDDKKAEIVNDGDGYYVVCYADNKIVKTIDVKEHSVYYAKDTAENWVDGISIYPW